MMAFTATATADPTPAQVKAAADEFDKGVAAARGGDPETAAGHFEKADAVAPSDASLRAAIRARRDAKQLARAGTLAALAVTRHAGNADLVAFSREVMDAAAKESGKLTITCKPTCELTVDRRIVHGAARPEVILFLDPGKHSVVAGWDDKTRTKDVVSVAGEAAQITLEQPVDPKPAAVPAAGAPVAKPPPPEPVAAASSGLPPAVFYGGLAITGVLAGVTVWSGLDTKSNPGPDKVKTACVGLGEGCPEYQDGLSRQRRTNALLATTGVVGVVTAVVGVFLTGWDRDSAPKQGLRATPALDVGPAGATVGATGRF
jgi:hypothetical protein